MRAPHLNAVLRHVNKKAVRTQVQHNTLDNAGMVLEVQREVEIRDIPPGDLRTPVAIVDV
jgi:hypothetical protein